MQNKSEMINRIAELAEENAELKKYIERMDKPKIQVIDAEILTLKEENAKLNAIIDSYQPRLQALKDENERLKEEIKEVKKYQYEQEFLEKEIEEQREKNKRLTCKILEVKALNETLNVQCTSQDCTQLRKLHQTLQEIKTIVEELSCKHPEDCWENTPDWNGEVYGCDVADNWKEPNELATCPSKLASAILQIITKAEGE